MESGYPMGTYNSGKRYDAVAPFNDEPAKRPRWGTQDSSENLVSSAAAMGYHPAQSSSRDSSVERQATLPDIGNRGGYEERRVI